jgi:hypothetical protein
LPFSGAGLRQPSARCRPGGSRLVIQPLPMSGEHYVGCDEEPKRICTYKRNIAARFDVRAIQSHVLGRFRRPSHGLVYALPNSPPTPAVELDCRPSCRRVDWRYSGHKIRVRHGGVVLARPPMLVAARRARAATGDAFIEAFSDRRGRQRSSVRPLIWAAVL